MGRFAIRSAIIALLGAVGIAGLAGCEAADRRDVNREYVIAGGVEEGIYYEYGREIARTLDDRLDAEFTAAGTAGSIDNLLRVGSGEALMGFAQSDVAADAIAGTGPFEERVPVQAVARLYEEYVHVVVRADSDIDELSDLAGRSISLGARTSGVNAVSTRILEAAEVRPSEVENPQLGLDDSLRAMRESEIDGFFWVGGLPTPGIERLAGDMPIRLLSIDEDRIERINAAHAGVYRVAEFPAGVYGRDESTVTMTVPNYLIVSASAPDDLVHDALAAVFAARSDMATRVPTAALLDRRLAIFTAPLELHPGAAKYYTESKR